jgi:CheY-like chemotaxis protein
MKKHILLIDDDREELNLFMEALQHVPGSYKCTYSGTGVNALEMLNYLHPDFIFLDYNLPDINGLEVLSRIKKDRKLHDVSIYLYSSVISDAKDRAAKSLGVDGCIQKPGSIGEMSIALKSIFLGIGMPA